ncbi:MAG: SpoIID/LytB domain-containing protein [Eubacteriales bacterium]
MKKAILLFLIITVMIIPSANAEDNNIWIRVGLKTYYEKVPSIHIRNSSIAIGYINEEEWFEETIINSNDGFTFVPATGTYLVSDGSYNNYEQAFEIVRELVDDNIPAYVGSVSLNEWKIYIGGEGYNAEDYLSKANDKTDNKFNTISDNNERVKMVTSTFTMIFENGLSNPQFRATYSSKDSVNALNLGERQYRGRIEIGRYGNSGVTAINVVPLEEYLYGVVPCEIIVSWPEESLKAQAVVARTYAKYYIDEAPKYPNEPYDLCDTISSQSYKGTSVEHYRTNQAVDLTKNELVYYKGSIIPTYFFSASGGHTEDSQNVWSASVPYLKGVPDIYETEPERKPWVMSLTPKFIEEKLQDYDVHIGQVVDVEIDGGYTEGGRVMGLKIIGTQGEHVVEKETMRYWFGLYSRKFKLVKNETPEEINILGVDGLESRNIDEVYVINKNGELDKLSDVSEQFIVIGKSNIENYPTIKGNMNEFTFVGQGWGHGIGMSQSGAKGMANKDYTYDEIIEYYYSGVNVQ